LQLDDSEMNDRCSEPGRSPGNHAQIEKNRIRAGRRASWLGSRPETGEPAGLPSVLWGGYSAALLISLSVTFAAMPLLPYLDQVNIVMLFLLAVVGVAAWYGRGPAVLVTVLNVLSFNFFVPPHFAFAFETLQSVLTFVVMLSVGLIVGQLTAQFRHQAQVAHAREERARPAKSAPAIFTRWRASCPGHWSPNKSSRSASATSRAASGSRRDC